MRFQDGAASAGNLSISVLANTNVNGSNSGVQFQGGAQGGTATINTNGEGSYVLFGSGGSTRSRPPSTTTAGA